MWSVVAPRWGDPRHPPLRLLTQLLTEGKSSLLHRALVEEGQLCSWVSADLSASLEPGAFSVVHMSVDNPGSGIVAIETHDPKV